jgi:hypothetical protein
MRALNDAIKDVLLANGFKKVNMLPSRIGTYSYHYIYSNMEYYIHFNPFQDYVNATLPNGESHQLDNMDAEQVIAYFKRYSKSMYHISPQGVPSNFNNVVTPNPYSALNEAIEGVLLDNGFKQISTLPDNLTAFTYDYQYFNGEYYIFFDSNNVFVNAYDVSKKEHELNGANAKQVIEYFNNISTVKDNQMTQKTETTSQSSTATTDVVEQQKLNILQYIYTLNLSDNLLTEQKDNSKSQEQIEEIVTKIQIANNRLEKLLDTIKSGARYVEFERDTILYSMLQEGITSLSESNQKELQFTFCVMQSESVTAFLGAWA